MVEHFIANLIKEAKRGNAGNAGALDGRLCIVSSVVEFTTTHARWP